MTPQEWKFAMETAAKVLKRLCSEHKYIGLHEAAGALFEAEGVVRSLPMPPPPDDLEGGPIDRFLDAAEASGRKPTLLTVDRAPPPQDKEPQV